MEVQPKNANDGNAEGKVTENDAQLTFKAHC